MTWLGAITAAKQDARRWRDRGRVGWGRTARNFLLSAVPTFSRGTTGVPLTELRRLSSPEIIRSRQDRQQDAPVRPHEGVIEDCFEANGTGLTSEHFLVDLPPNTF
jgi:hypothetical protein